MQVDKKISFLDVLIIRSENGLDTTVYRKPRDNDIYLQWHAFTPINGSLVGKSAISNKCHYL